MSAAIKLANEPPFAIGPLQIHPSSHEVARDGRREIVEPRVMQVLIALAQADGAVLTRDELVFRCWDGRVVGDDAIHRVLSRLRRMTDGIARDVFKIETITKVGYRLIRCDTARNAEFMSQLGEVSGAFENAVGRRTVVAGAGAAALLAVAGLWFAESGKHKLPHDAQALMERGRLAMREGSPDQISSAASLFRKAAETAPADARPWGALALAYSFQRVHSPREQKELITERARSAANRALSIDHENSDALTATVNLGLRFRRWSAFERGLKRVYAKDPNHWILNMLYASFLTDVGRHSKALQHLDRAIAEEPLSPHLQWMRTVTLWSQGRLDEADSTIDQAFELYPRHYAIWFVRNMLLAHTGRAKAALAMLAETHTRPIGIPDWNFELSQKAAQALDSRSKSDMEAAVAAHLEAAQYGVGFAEAAVSLASALGLVDRAFEIATDYYFTAKFSSAESRWSKEQGIYSSASNRHTFFLFSQPTAALRDDPRFDPLVIRLGLEGYWGEAGQPDYRNR